MVASRRNWRAADEDDEEVVGRTMLKTYLVEAHCPEGNGETVDSLADLGGILGFQVSSTDDSCLFRLSSA